MSVGAQGKAKKSKPKPRLLPGLAVKDGLIRHPFDLEFGVRTSGLIAGRNLHAGHRHDRHITAYYAIAPSVFQNILVRWRRCRPIAPLDAYTFIDLGAGMGRALLLAAAYPFRAVVGVELHPTLAHIARRNLSQWRAAGRTRVPCACIVASRGFPASVRALPGFSLQPLWRARAAAAASSMETKLCRPRRATEYSVCQ